MLFDYNGRKHVRMMAPFDRSTEREFALTVNRRAIDDCSNLEQLKPIAKSLLEGWSSLQSSFQSLMLENLQLRQAISMRDYSLRAADEMLNEAVVEMQRYEQKLKRANKRPWPFG
mgnify:FL=1